MLDYLVTEAVTIKATHEENEARKKAERDAEMKRKKKEAQQSLYEQYGK